MFFTICNFIYFQISGYLPHVELQNKPPDGSGDDHVYLADGWGDHGSMGCVLSSEGYLESTPDPLHL